MIMNKEPLVLSTSAKPATPALGLLKNPIHLLAFGFGSGYAKVAPGTFGTLAAVPLAALCSFFLSDGLYLTLAVLVGLLSIPVCGYTSKSLGVHDHPAIVLDEFAGYFLALIFLPVSLVNLALTFVLFRLFDIWKPGPIGWCDRHFHGGLGIVLDDLLAGLAAAGVIHLGYWLFVTG